MKTKWIFSLVMIAALLAACAPQSTPAPSALTSTNNNTKIVNISSFKFDPASVTIKAGETVTWTNQDSVAHTVVSDDGSWASKSLAQGDKFTHTFDKSGTFTYKCGVHPSMKGTVVVQ